MTDATAPDHLDLPGSGDWLAWVADRCEGQLATARALVDEVKAGGDAGRVLATWNRAETAIANAEAVALWAEVHPAAAVRDRADELSQDVQKYVTELGLDRDLYAVFDGLSADGLDDDARRVLEHTLRDFRRAGVDRDEATRDRLRELSERGVKLSQDFGRNIRDVNTVNGARVTLEDGAWVLVRASSNKPELVVVVESMTSEDDMRALFREEVKPRLAQFAEVGAYNQKIEV